MFRSCSVHPIRNLYSTYTRPIRDLYKTYMQLYEPAEGKYYIKKQQTFIKRQVSIECLPLYCDPCRIQTCNPHIRSVVLYSVELMDLVETRSGAD